MKEKRYHDGTETIKGKMGFLISGGFYYKIFIAKKISKIRKVNFINLTVCT